MRVTDIFRPLSGESLDEGGRLRVSFSGDLCPFDSYEECFAEGNVGKAMPEIINELEKSDLHITNLETPISCSGKPMVKCGPNFRTSPAVVKGLKQLKVTHACLANNHIRDFGDSALLDTIYNLGNNNIMALGAVKGENTLMKPYLFEQNGVKVCLINAAEGEFSRPIKDGWGASVLDEVAIINLLHSIRRDVDVIFLSLHAGLEYKFFPAPFLQKMYRNFIDAGADAVIGHHPHVPQGIEIYMDKLICYSLGNFVFDRPGMRTKTGTEFSFLVNFDLTANGIKRCAIVPFERNPDNTLTLLRKERKHFFKEFLYLISEPLYSEDILTSIWDEYVRKNIDLYMTHLAMAYNAYPFKHNKEAEEHKSYLLNVNSSCLSHRKMLERIIQLVAGDKTKSNKYAEKTINNCINILNKLRQEHYLKKV